MDESLKAVTEPHLLDGDEILISNTEKADPTEQEKVVKADEISLLESKFDGPPDGNKSAVTGDVEGFNIGENYGMNKNAEKDILNFLQSESVNNFNKEHDEKTKNVVSQHKETSENNKLKEDNLLKDWTATVKHDSLDTKSGTYDTKSNLTNMLINAEQNDRNPEIKKEPLDKKEHDENVIMSETKDDKVVITGPAVSKVETAGIVFEEKTFSDENTKGIDGKINESKHQEFPDDSGKSNLDKTTGGNVSEEKKPKSDDVSNTNLEMKDLQDIDKNKKIANKPENTSVAEKTKPAVAEEQKNISEDVSEIGPKELFSNYGLNTWFNPECLNPTVEAIIYWRDPKVSGIVFGSTLVVLLSLAYFSLISVVANLGLSVLVSTIGFRIYKEVLQTVQKTPQVHPLQFLLSRDITLPKEKVHEIVDNVLIHINACIAELRRLFLVENLIDSIKYGVVLWILTYVGAWFNGLTLVIIGFVALFTLPKIYENNKVQIDQNIKLAQLKLDEFTNKIKESLPAPLRRRLPEKNE